MSVVVPNWNGRHLIDGCVASLQAQTYPNVEILVVDNASTDGSVDFMLSEYPDVRVLVNVVNEGFAGGVNRGIREARGIYIAVLNNDAVAESDWVAELVEGMASRAGTGIVASKAIKRDARLLDGAGDHYSIWSIPFPRGRDEPDGGRFDEDAEVFAASGAACLIDRAVLDDVGMFDEDFFAYYEDVDLAFRARLRGWGVIYRSTARVQHQVGATSQSVEDLVAFHSLKNIVYVYVKNMPRRLFWRYLPRFAFVLMAMLVRRAFASPRGLLTAGRVVGTVLRTLPSTLMKRWEIQRRRTVTHGAIDGLLYREMPPIQTQTLRAFRRSPSRALDRFAAWTRRRH